jgi:16S rRNA (cytosine967-C5)-methyltransferase
MNARELAYESLLAIFKDNGYSNIVVARMIQRHSLADRDRRLYTELVYGTLRYINYLDWIIGKLSSRKLNKLDMKCLIILRMGLYQLFCLTKIPDSAACNESVKLALRYGNTGMSKFVNGLLRNSIRQRDQFHIPSLEEDELLHISLTYHQPLWLVKKFIKAYGRDDAMRAFEYFDTVPDLCVRTNTTKISREELLRVLNERELDAEPAAYAPEGIYIRHMPGIQDLQEMKQGLCQIQDEPSMLVCHVLDPQPKDTVFDVCAAPGGKTTHIAERMGQTGTVYGCDIYEHKLKLIEDNVQRLGLRNVRALLQDACTIGSVFPGKADKVLVDAPCSGLGVLKRKLDLRWRKRPEEIQALPALQKRILDSAACCVKPGGVLVYSTCTMNDDENIRIIEDFLATHPEFHADDATKYISIPMEGPYIQILPQRHGLDGFFIARLVKGDTND